MTCTVMSGIMATSATRPNASVITLPPSASHAPMANGSMNVAVSGPEATPPESNAMAVNVRGTTNIIVAQRIGTIRDADCILVIEDGAIVGKGTHRELMESCKVYQEIAYSQLSKEELAS